MPQTLQLIDTLKQALKAQRKTYADVADTLALSQASDTSQALASTVIVGALPGRGKSFRAAITPWARARSTQRVTV